MYYWISLLLCCSLAGFGAFAQGNAPILADTVSRIAKVDNKWNDPDLGNLLSRKAGAKIIACSSMDSAGWLAENLIDDRKGHTAIWRTEYRARGPHVVVIELPEPQELTTFAINTKYVNEDSLEGVSPKAIRLEVSAQDPNEGYKTLEYNWKLKRKSDENIINLPMQSAVRWVRLTIKANFGNPHYTELGRIYAYNDTRVNQFRRALREDGMLDVADIQFEHNSADVLTTSYHLIETVGRLMAENPDWDVIIEGHTDNSGLDKANLQLSKQRAMAVKALLIEAGIDPGRLTCEGHGDSKPIVENDSPEHMAQNRRVTFRLKDMPTTDGAD